MASQNYVSPEDVGARVSFQYELPNGYVGEAVGTFARFDEAADAYIVVDRDGNLRRVPRASVRFGKVVPEGPPPRPY